VIADRRLPDRQQASIERHDLCWFDDRDDLPAPRGISGREPDGNGVSIWGGSTVDYGCRIADRVKIPQGLRCPVFGAREDVFLAPGVVSPTIPTPAAAVEGLHAGPDDGAGADRRQRPSSRS
jgi:hypothetical protein